jgi:ParB-like chromosome segregation protein Spo0J
MINELDSHGTQAVTIRRINLGELHASPTNPRQHFDAEALAELASSIEEHGVKMPLLARPSKSEPGKYEIVAGERRFRATTLLVTRLPERMEIAGEDEGRVKELETLLAARVEVPVIVEDLDDATVLELQLIENLQRRDLTALEEARGYQRLLDLNDKGYTPQKIAAKIGKSVNTVLYKLKMLKAPKPMQEALDAGLIGERHLVLVAAIPGQKAREECAKKVLSGGETWDNNLDKWVKCPLSIRDTLAVINDEYRASLKGVPWDLEDPQLVPDAGACATCPFFAQHAAKEDKDLAAELGNGRGQTDPLTCLNPPCHKAKHNAIFARKKAEAKEAGTVTIVPAKEADKLVTEDGRLRNSNYVRLDEKPGYEHTGHYDREKNPVWRELVEDRLPAGAIQVVNTKEAGVIELVEVKVAIAAAREHKKHGKLFQKVTASSKKVLTDDEKKAKEKEAFEAKVTARSKVCYMQYLRDRALEKGMDRDAALAVLDTVLREAGKDGCQLMAEMLAIQPREKKKNEYGVVADAYREPILEALRTQDAGKPEIDALIMLGVIAKYVKNWGLGFSSKEPLEAFFGFDAKTIKALATAEVKAEIEAKAAKKKPEKVAAKDHTDPTHVDSAKEASKTKAADSRAKRGMRKPEGPARNASRSDAGGGMTKEAGPSATEEATGIQDSKLGKATGWTPADVEAGAALLKAKTHDITTLIGSKPDRKKDAIAYKNWNGLRMKLLRKAGLAK